MASPKRTDRTASRLRTMYPFAQEGYVVVLYVGEDPAPAPPEYPDGFSDDLEIWVRLEGDWYRQYEDMADFHILGKVHDGK